MRKRIRSVGTHNTLDGVAPGTGFADVVLFTEAIPNKLAHELAASHDLYSCRWQRDLAIAVRKTLPISNVREHYRLAHPGLIRVTPHRGSYWLTFRLDVEDCMTLDEHRINAAWPPYIRGEGRFRRLMWRRHTNLTRRIVRRRIRRGFKVYAGGDLNTPEGVSGYEGLLHEVGDDFDRLASTEPLSGVTVKSKLGSDHSRLRALAS